MVCTIFHATEPKHDSHQCMQCASHTVLGLVIATLFGVTVLATYLGPYAIGTDRKVLVGWGS
jgi:hypothetical protein